MARVQPELAAILDAHGSRSGAPVETSEEPIQVVLRLRPQESELVDSPEVTRRVAADLLDRVEARIHEQPVGFNVFANLGSVAVAASPHFLSELVHEPEVQAALLGSSSPAVRRP